MLRTKKRLLASLSTISLIEVIGRNPAIAGILALLGVGGGAVIATNLITPSIVPFISSNFNPNQTTLNTSNSLTPNGGTAGALELPASPTDSFAVYFEMTVNPSLGYSPTTETPFTGASLDGNSVPGLPHFYFSRQWNGSSPGSWWWFNPGMTPKNGGSSTNPSLNYATGFYPVTAPTTPNCTGRQPTGIWMPQSNVSSIFQQIDPGLGCPTGTPPLNAAAIAASIPGSGAQVATGLNASPAQAATTCVSNSPVAGEMTVTVHLALTHGIYPGLQYTLQGFSGVGFTGYNATYTALAGTTGSTLIGETATGGGTCPTSPLDTAAHEGTALSGTGGSVTFPAVSATAAFN